MKTSLWSSTFIKNPFRKNEEDNKSSDIFPNINIKGSNTIKFLRINGKKAEFIWLEKYIADYIQDNFWVKIDSSTLLPKWLSIPSLVKKSTTIIKDSEYIQVLWFNIKKSEYDIDVDIYTKKDTQDSFIFNIYWLNKVWRLLEYWKTDKLIDSESIEYDIILVWVNYDDYSKPIY